jgi:hypothetical protein
MRQLTLTEWQQLNDAASRGDRLAYWTVLQGAVVITDITSVPRRPV